MACGIRQRRPGGDLPSVGLPQGGRSPGGQRHRVPAAGTHQPLLTVATGG